MLLLFVAYNSCPYKEPLTYTLTLVKCCTLNILRLNSLSVIMMFRARVTLTIRFVVEIRYLDDVEIMKAMGLKNYRFSLSWSRILPDGTTNIINQPGIDYYNNLIDAMIDADIAPMVTLYHWDLPQALQDYGGWQNESVIEHYEIYADLCFREFGDRVKLWITFNEPWVVSMLGHGTGEFAPGIREDGTTTYVVSHNIIKAHANAYHTYNDTYRNTQVSITRITRTYHNINIPPLGYLEGAAKGGHAFVLECNEKRIGHQ